MDLDEDIKEMYEELAAMIHFLGGLPLEKAEKLAMAEAEAYQVRRDALIAIGEGE